jgi:hypothetical protein
MLARACALGDYGAVDALCKSGARAIMPVKGMSGSLQEPDTPLSVCAAFGYARIALLLVETHGAGSRQVKVKIFFFFPEGNVRHKTILNRVFV